MFVQTNVNFPRKIMDKENKFKNSILSKNKKNVYCITIKKIEKLFA